MIKDRYKFGLIVMLILFGIFIQQFDKPDKNILNASFGLFFLTAFYLLYNINTGGRLHMGKNQNMDDWKRKKEDGCDGFEKYSE